LAIYYLDISKDKKLKTKHTGKFTFRDILATLENKKAYINFQEQKWYSPNKQVIVDLNLPNAFYTK